MRSGAKTSVNVVDGGMLFRARNVLTEIVASSIPLPSSRLTPDASLVQDAAAAYLGLAIGDALGATVEFMTPREIKAMFDVHDEIFGAGWLRLRPGQVTDDTTMSLALGESILAKGKVDAMAAAQAFDAWMRAKPVDIGNTVRRGLVRFRHTQVPEADINEHDAGNGAAMRILPVALATLGQPEEQVRLACRAQAHITHNNPISDAATECLALMVQDMLRGADKQTVLKTRVEALVAQYPIFAFQQRRVENPSGYVVETLQAVFQAFFGHAGTRECLIDVVNRGGDADTTGAITGMLAGALYGMVDLPGKWLDKLEQTSRTACEQQARALVELSCHINTKRGWLKWV